MKKKKILRVGCPNDPSETEDSLGSWIQDLVWPSESTVASADGGNGALFSSVTEESECFWIGTTTFACFLGLSGVVGRALSMGLSAIMKESE